MVNARVRLWRPMVDKIMTSAVKEGIVAEPAAVEQPKPSHPQSTTSGPTRPEPVLPRKLAKLQNQVRAAEATDLAAAVLQAPPVVRPVATAPTPKLPIRFKVTDIVAAASVGVLGDPAPNAPPSVTPSPDADTTAVL